MSQWFRRKIQKRKRMKTCPQCDSGYPDSHTTCPTHGLPLNEIRDLKPGMIIHQSYRIVRKLGQGGMGAVYLAQHTLMDEPRALKFLSSELSQDQAFTSRFLREVRVLRQIRNRNVVDCGDLEAAEDGSLFFSMEFVDGPDLRGLLNNTTGPFYTEQALSIARQIAEGLGAAHLKGMVHRDIKPENILMARDGDRWLPKIADFGIVATKESSTAYTRTGGTLLTMAYAAPEQWRGTPAAELDGRTDLYALGGVFYEMLTSRTAFYAENYEGWARQHQTTPPQPPSTHLPSLANWRGLDALVLRLLAKDRSDRPEDVSELLNLLDAIVYVTPKTRQVTVPEVWQATVWENARSKEQKADEKPRRLLPGWVWAASVFVLLIAGFAIWRILGPQQAVPTTLPSPRPWLTAEEQKENLQPSTTVQQHQENPQPSHATQQQQQNPLPVINHPVSVLRTLQGHSGYVHSVAFSPSGRTLASGSGDYTIKLWDAVSGQLLRTLQGHSNLVESVAFSPNGRTMASGSYDHTIKLWDKASGQLLRTLQDTGEVFSVAFSPNGHTLASGSYDGTVKLWDVASGELLRTLQGHSNFVDSVAFSPNDRILASGGGEGIIKLWDAASGQLLRTLQGHSNMIESVVFSPNGRTLASGSADKTIKLWDAASGELLRTLQGHQDYVDSVAFSPDGRTLASGSNDNTIKLWDVASGQLLRTLQYTCNVYSIAFNPDGRTLASGSVDNTIKLWDVSGLNH